jgi:DNA-binding HxlR family transcriptional regulator
MVNEQQFAVSISSKKRPIMALLDLLGRRWAMRILWELRDGALSSRALRSAAGEISPTVLQARIHELREAGLICLDKDGYSLSKLGRELNDVFIPLFRFAERWAGAKHSRE